MTKEQLHKAAQLNETIKELTDWINIFENRTAGECALRTLAAFLSNNPFIAEVTKSDPAIKKCLATVLKNIKRERDKAAKEFEAL